MAKTSEKKIHLGEILVVDDNPNNLKLLVSMLAAEGYQVRPANSPQLALDSVKTWVPDLILLDVRMPVMDGYEVCKRLKESKHTCEIPIIFVSAQKNLEDQIKGFEVGGVDYITKPIRREEVLARVRTHISLYRMQVNLEHLVQARTSEIIKTNEALIKNEAKFRRLIEGLGTEYCIYAYDIEGTYYYVSPTIEGMLGYTPEEFQAHHKEYLTENPCNEVVIQHTNLSINGKKQAPYEMEIYHKDGSILWLEITESPVFNSLGGVEAVEGIAHNITERKQFEIAQALAATAFETQEAIMITDAKGIILKVNEAFTKITGYSSEEAVNQNPRFLKSGRHDEAFYEVMWRILLTKNQWNGEIWNRRKNGEIYPEWLGITVVKDKAGKIAHYVANFLDITERKRAEAKIEYQSYYDSLTDLPNRRLVLDRLQQDLIRSRRFGNAGALLFLNLDRFEAINDSLGHAAGDEILKQTAKRLAELLSSKETVARVGSDEFVVMLPELNHIPEHATSLAQRFAEKVKSSLSMPYPLHDQKLHITASIGISVYPLGNENADDVLGKADIAMHRAKEMGGDNFQFYLPNMQHAASERLSIENDLRQGLENDEFYLNFQPQLNSKGEICGAEALLRWQNKQRGLVSPLEFIHIAEESGLIIPIGEWVIKTACKLIKKWSDAGIKLKLAVNVSPKQFQQVDFVALVLGYLSDSGVDPQQLELELTESLLVANVDDAINKMQNLKSFGIGISIDDFGTGYSSLSYLKRLPIDKLKIDQSFVFDISSDTNDAQIVETIISMTQHLNLSVIAEGVETEEQLRFLYDKGCHLYQGYFFSKPLPEQDFLAFVKNAPVKVPID